MSFSMGSLLIHSDGIPPGARDALRAAHRAGGGERRGEMLESAARVLHRETGLDCRDARELVDLAPDGCCG